MTNNMIVRTVRGGLLALIVAGGLAACGDQPTEPDMLTAPQMTTDTTKPPCPVVNGAPSC